VRTKAFPKQFIHTVAQGIIDQVQSNAGMLAMLELFEEVPPEFRHRLLSSLSVVHDTAIAAFYHVVILEYGQKYEDIAARALQKLYMAGVQSPPLDFLPGRFNRAYCTGTRHLGRVNLMIIWETAADDFAVENFLLHFSPEGIVNYMLMEHVGRQHSAEFPFDDTLLSNMQELTEEETRLLLTSAYQFNCDYSNPPALGLYLFRRHFLDAIDLADMYAVIRRVSKPTSARQYVNTIFLALQKLDWLYLAAISDEAQILPAQWRQLFAEFYSQEQSLVEGGVTRAETLHDLTVIKAYAIGLRETKIIKTTYTFSLAQRQDGWRIVALAKNRTYELKEHSRLNPLNVRMYCQTYEILDVDELITLLGELDKIQEVGELPNGLHIRVMTWQYDIEQVVCAMSGALADMVVSGDELAVICRDQAVLESLHQRIMLFDILQKTGEYRLPLKTVLHFLDGGYAHLEDVCVETDYEYLMGEDMRFITAKYEIADFSQLQAFLSAVPHTRRYVLEEDVFLHYQFSAEDMEHFVAEYILEHQYLAVSGFGNRAVETVCRNVEKALAGQVAFLGVEIRPTSIFDLLTPEIMRHFPQIAYDFKAIYLDQWYHSKSPYLDGMTPADASKTENGRRLLWSMFKIIQKKLGQDTLLGPNLTLREFMDKLEVY
jgi:hypothetical protein